MEHQFISIAGRRLCVALDGPESGPPLALINGAFSNLHSWTPAMSTLSKSFRVIRHDWRGSGQSEAGKIDRYSFEGYADDLAELLDRYAAGPAIICGMAYGARIAARFALRHPQRTKLLALYDVSLDQPVDQALQREGNERAQLLRAEAGLSEPIRQRDWFEHADRHEAMRSLRAHLGQPDPTPELASLPTPTLVVCGEQDVNLGEAQRIAATLPDSEFHVMPMTGHGSVLSRPELFCDLLIDFVRRRL